MEIEKKLIDAVLGQHPAHKIEFDELYAGLMDNVEQGFISKKYRGDLELFNYTKNTMFDKNWNIFTLISRGLILNPREKRVIATPFPKFFNYGEIEIRDSESIWESELHDGEVVALEKLDGSLGIVYHHDNEWHCATRGAFDSEQAVWGTKWIRQNIDTTSLDIGHTYLFEIIYPENKIVVSYDYEGMVLLSAYCNNGFEYNSNDLNSLIDNINIRKAVEYPYIKIHDFLNEAEIIDKNNEGWVIRFSNGHRIKIKGSKYCRIHRLVSNITPLGVWDIIQNMQDFDSIRKDLPEEHLKDFDILYEILDSKMSNLIESIRASAEERKDLSDKDVGLSMAKGTWPDGKSVTDLEKKFMFFVRKSRLDKALTSNGKDRRVLFNYIRPTGNVLEGYTPSKAIDRFQNESS